MSTDPSDWLASLPRVLAAVGPATAERSDPEETDVIEVAVGSGQDAVRVAIIVADRSGARLVDAPPDPARRLVRLTVGDGTPQAIAAGELTLPGALLAGRASLSGDPTVLMRLAERLTGATTADTANTSNA